MPLAPPCQALVAEESLMMPDDAGVCSTAISETGERTRTEQRKAITNSASCNVGHMQQPQPKTMAHAII